MQKTVQIPKKLFLELIRYHLGEIPADEAYIKQELQKKLQALASRERYSQAITAGSDQERRDLLQIYYQTKGANNES